MYKISNYWYFDLFFLIKVKLSQKVITITFTFARNVKRMVTVLVLTANSLIAMNQTIPKFSVLRYMCWHICFTINLKLNMYSRILKCKQHKHKKIHLIHVKNIKKHKHIPFRNKIIISVSNMKMFTRH